MKYVNGVPVFSAIDEILAPEHTALIVEDVQNDPSDPDGWFARHGKDVSRVGEIVRNVKLLLDAARSTPPGADVMLPAHAAATVYMGPLIGENFYLDEPAARCAQIGSWEFLLVAPPLPFSKALGSPINPLAVL